MELMFIGADHEVTGSCHYLQVGKIKMLIDCGMEQGGDRYENAQLPVLPSEIDYVLVTHAHIDHTGMLPKLVHDGFAGKIVATQATAELCGIMLRDSAHIQMMEAEWRNKKARRAGSSDEYEPVYTMEDALNTVRLLDAYPYDKKVTLCEGVQFRFTDIGHLLGSSSIELWITEGGVSKKIVFSGDIGNINQPLLRDPAPTDEADYVLIESTYGDRLHEKEKGDSVEEFADILTRTFRRGGNVIIPAFAVGRTQVLLYYLRQIKENNMVPEFPDFPVYVDSPLAVEATQVFYECGQSCYDEEAMALIRKGINPISFPNLKLTISTDESKAINQDDEPKVVISASGMCDAGRIKHHLKHNLWRDDSTIVFVGYQAVGSPGRKIVDGADEIKIFGEPVAVRAEIVNMEGMSGHADRNGLLSWINAFKEKPKQVFVVHGDDEVATSFAKDLTEDFGFNAMAPFSGTRYDLSNGKFIQITQGIPVSKEAHARSISDSYTNLRLTGKRVQEFIMGCEGLPNKELDKFARELEALCQKYKR